MIKQLVAILSLVLLLGFAGCQPAAEETSETPAPADQPADAPAQPQTAVANLTPTQGNNVSGTITFTETGGQVQISGEITGLTPGLHGFHIHETGDCSAPDGTSAGGHWAPEGHPHGAPDAAQHHAGDLGNIEANAQGTASVNISASHFTVAAGQMSVVGKALIVHADPDDMTTQPTGNAGARLACGVIEMHGLGEGSGMETPAPAPAPSQSQ